jgi:hypothetical protein
MPSRVAAGNIAPSRFVTPSTTADGKVTQATAGQLVCGISHAGTRNVPGSSLGLDDGYHAIAGENCGVHEFGEMNVLLELVGTVTRGDFIKASTDGKGVTADTDKDYYGARALRSGVSGELIPVHVVQGYFAV